MKYLVTLALLFVVYLIWRAGRKPKSGTPEAGRSIEAQDMVPCSLCALHVPAAEAVQGRLGPYCSAQHRDQNEN